MAGHAYLEGITVLDLSSVGPAARASRILADYGARVIKVAPPPSKQGALIEPPYHSYGAGRGMLRVRIDLKAPQGCEAFIRLAALADVVIESFRPGVTARLGIGYEQLRGLKPDIVYCATSGYGRSGPRSAWAGHDLDYLAVAGFLHCSGRRADGGPAFPGATVADAAAGGMQAVIAILAALRHRDRSGEGAFLDVSVADGVLQLMALHVDEHLATGAEPGPGSSLLTGGYACYDVYQAHDGRWLAVAAIEPAFFANLCKALGLERFVAHQMDDARQEEIREAFAEAFATKDRDSWVVELGPRDTCVAPVNDIAEVVDDEQFKARRAFGEAQHPDHGRLRQLAPLLAGTAVAAEEVVTLPAAATTDTDELLGEAGLGSAEIEGMRAEGIVA